jgi:hypothetical protein
VAPWSDWRQRQHDHYPGGKTDFSHASDMIAKVYGDDSKAAGLHRRYLEAEAERLVEEYWALIEHLAQTLHARKAMTGKEVHDVLLAFTAASIESWSRKSKFATVGADR